MKLKLTPVAFAVCSALAPLAAQAAPKVAFVAPTSGQTISGSLYQSSACEVKGTSDIRRVVFWLDGGTQLNAEGNAPWTCNLDTRKYADGTHKLKAVAYDSRGRSGTAEISVVFDNVADSGGSEPTPPPPDEEAPTPPASGYSGTPYSGAPIAVPGTFEAEDFDKGGDNVAYRDLSSGNAGGQYRAGESVDIVSTRDPEGGNYSVNYFQTGEWMAYTINVPADGTYELSLRAANKNITGAAFRAEIDGVDVTGKVAVAATGSWDAYQWFAKGGIPLKAGQHVLKIIADQQYFDVNRIRVAATSTTPPASEPPPYAYSGTPFGGTPIAVPKAFEAEDFDKGGEGVAYRDLTATNVTGLYRPGEAVDIVASTDAAGGGHVVNYFQTGEWMAYTLNVPADGSYDISIRAANKNIEGAAFRAQVDGVDVTGSVPVAATGSWDTFKWVGKSGVPLKAGKRILKIIAEKEYFDVNAVSVLAAGTGGSTPPQNQPPSVSFKAPTSGAELKGLVNSTTCEVSATDDVKVARVDFAMGGQAVGSKTVAPWQCAIDTTRFSDGGYQLVATAYDEAGKSAKTEVAVSVQNGTGGGDPLPGETPPGLLFWTGYEGTTTLGAPIDCYKNGCFQEINGKDSWTGFTWPPILNSSNARYQMLANAGSAPSPSTIDQYMWNEVQTVTGPKGTQTRAMYSHIAKSGCCGTGEQGSGSTQLPYLIYPQSDVKELYVSKWLKLQGDLSQKMGSGNWRAIFETKTTDTDHRLVVYVNTDSSGKPYWMVRTDSWTPTHVDFWRDYNYDVAVPVGQWFKFEAYFKRSAGSDGRVWVAVNGKVITDKYGPTMGPNKSPINRVFLTQLYSGSSYPIYQWVDNVQVWNTFPSVSSGAPWYDPPYAPH
jgi:hypothetical protein